jgi:hypothetical protein
MVPGPRIKTDGGPAGVAVGNFVGTGRLDLAVSNRQANNVQIFSGLGGGFFNDQNARTFSVGSQPGPLFVGNFDGKPDLVTVNAGSNDLTVISNFTSADPVTYTIASGGLDPVTAFQFSSASGFDNLLVANNGDGAFALFEGSAQGLSLLSTTFEAELPSPTALAFSALAGGEVQFYAATEGREAAILVALSLGGASFIPAPSALEAPSIENNVAQLVALQESSLALVGTLLVVTLESPAGELSVIPPEVEAGTAIATLSAAPAALGQGLSGQSEFELGPRELDQQSSAPEQPAIIPALPRAMSWERFVLGTDEALERYDREHQEGSTKPQGRQGEGKPAAAEPETGSPLPADRSRDEGFIPREGQPDEVVDEAIDRVRDGARWWCGLRAWREQAVAATALEVPGAAGSETCALKLSGPSAPRSGNPAGAPRAVVFGAVAAGWTCSGWALRKTKGSGRRTAGGRFLRAGGGVAGAGSKPRARKPLEKPALEQDHLSSIPPSC